MTQPTLADHATVRAMFPALEAGVYLNTGTYTIMPEPALNQYITLSAAYEGHPHPARLRLSRP